MFFNNSILKIERLNIPNRLVVKLVKICMLSINIKLNFMVFNEFLETLYLNANNVLIPH